MARRFIDIDDAGGPEPPSGPEVRMTMSDDDPCNYMQCAEDEICQNGRCVSRMRMTDGGFDPNNPDGQHFDGGYTGFDTRDAINVATQYGTFVNMVKSPEDICNERASRARFASMEDKNNFIAECIAEQQQEPLVDEDAIDREIQIEENETLLDVEPPKPTTAGMKSSVLLWVVIGLGLVYLVDKKVIKI